MLTGIFFRNLYSLTSLSYYLEDVKLITLVGVIFVPDCQIARTLSRLGLLCLLRPRGYKTCFMLNSGEREICPANKSQITNNCKFFLAKHNRV